VIIVYIALLVSLGKPDLISIQAYGVRLGSVANGEIVDGRRSEDKDERAGMVALAAETTGFMLLLFPELAALSHDIMVRPYGKWGSQPLRLVLTPTLTDVVGIFIARHLTFGDFGISLIVALSLLIILLFEVDDRGRYFGGRPTDGVERTKLALPFRKFDRLLRMEVKILLFGLILS
jgi:hypothetical protein